MEIHVVDNRAHSLNIHGKVCRCPSKIVSTTLTHTNPSTTMIEGARIPILRQTVLLGIQLGPLTATIVSKRVTIAKARGSTQARES